MNFKRLAILFLVLLGIAVATQLVLKSIRSEKTVEEVAVKKIGSERLLELISESSAQLKLVNMWATWCLPCVAEFPYLLQLREKYADQGLELFLVSADFPTEGEALRKFLKERGVDFLTYWKDEDDNSFINALSPDWSGALPTTFLYDENGELITFWTGEASYEEFEERTTPHL